MMKKMLRLIALLLLVLVCLSACAQDDTDTDPTDAGSTPTDSTDSSDDAGNTDDSSNNGTTAAQDENKELLAAADAIQIANKKKTSYRIVIDNRLTNAQKNTVELFRTRITTKTGATLDLADDRETPTNKEILVYAMDGRESDMSGVLNKITAPDQKGYRIEVVDERIIVACNDPIYIEPALALLSDAIRECDDGSFGIEKDYVGKLDLPKPVTGQMSLTTSLYTAQNNYTVTVRNASKSNYTNFVKSLTADGFYAYDTNTIGSASFGTYVKDSLYAQQAVYTMYYPDDQCYKVTYGPLDYLPNLRASSSDVTTPFFSQPMTNSGGLRTVMRLENGEFIVFDGGNPSSADQEYLLNFLKEHSPNGQVTIAAWIITHAHGDHLGMANQFLDAYASSINLKLVAYNFPDWDNAELVWDESQGDTGSMEGLATRFKSILDEKYPQTEQWVVHTGQTLQLAGCEIEVLYTPEDYATGESRLKEDGTISFPSGNHTNIALRLTFGETTIITPGDSESELCQWMGETYAGDLKSDVLYLTHHGYNGGDLNFYREIDPDICIWPTTASGKQEYTPMFPYNQYLMNAPGYGGRDRVHHTQDVETIYEITDDGPVLVKGTPAQ